jgi:hypothetical protein
MDTLGVVTCKHVGTNTPNLYLLLRHHIFNGLAQLQRESGRAHPPSLSPWLYPTLHQTELPTLLPLSQMLQDAGLPDCAQAYVEACEQAGLLIPAPGTSNPSPFVGGAATASAGPAGPAAPAAAQSGQPRTPKTPKTPKAAGHLFDLLGQRHSSHLPGTGRWTARAGSVAQQQQQQQQAEDETRSSPRKQSLPAGDLTMTRWECERYMKELLGKL